MGYYDSQAKETPLITRCIPVGDRRLKHRLVQRHLVKSVCVIDDVWRLREAARAVKALVL